MTERIRISDLSLYHEVTLILQDYSTDGQYLDREILDKNHDDQLDYKRQFLKDFTIDQFLGLQQSLTRFSFRMRDSENVLEAFEAKEILEAEGRDAAEIFSKLDAVVPWFLESYAWQIPQLLKSLGGIDSLVEFLSLLKTTPPFDNASYWGIRFALSFLHQTPQPIMESDWAQYLSVVSTLAPYSGGLRRHRSVRTLEQLSLDWRQCSTLDGFGRELAHALNQKCSTDQSDPRWPELLSNASGLLCDIYEHEKERDSTKYFISGFCDILNDKTFYQLVAHNYGGFMMTTIFDLLWTRRGVSSVQDWLGQVDPTEQLTERFLFNLSSLDRVRVMSGEVDFVFEKLFERFEQGSSLYSPSQMSMMMTHYFDELLPAASTSSRRRFAQKLVRAYSLTEENSVSQKAVLFWLKYYGPKYQLDSFDSQIAELIAQAPELPDMNLPLDGWLSDGVLRSRQSFYSEEPYSENPDEKSDGQNWFEYTVELLTEAGWQVVETDLSGTTKKIKLTKSVNGIVLETTLTLQNVEDEIEILDGQSQFEILAHRGHSDTLEFSSNPSHFSLEFSQLLYLGSCKSMSFATSDEFTTQHSKQFIVADLDVSRGITSVQFLDQLMTNVARGRADWSAYRRFETGYKFVLPNHPIFLLQKYLSLEN